MQTIVQPPEKPWTSWNLYDWAPRLLDHYFGLADGSQPVESLTVTPEQLAAIAGDRLADPQVVADTFRRRLLSGASGTGFWRHAVLLQERFPEAAFYFAHLIVSCLAATDADEIDEFSYVDRLRAFTEPERGDLERGLMAQLWCDLASWLADRPDQYSRLTLPDPGGYTLIGYTVKLAFPSRRDLRHLVQRLEMLELLVEDPPVGLVLNALATAGQATFSERFRQEVTAFKQRRASGATLSELRTSPLWAAVMAATAANAQADPNAERETWALLASDDGFYLDFELACEGAIAPAGGVTVGDRQDSFGRWTHLGMVDGDRDRAVEALLGGTLDIPALSSLVRRGLVPFIEGPDGDIESTVRRGDLQDVRSVLVADQLLEPLLARFPSPRKPRPSGIAGWTYVEGLRLTTLSSDELAGTTLAECWMLHESPVPAQIRASGGIRVGSSWLGARDCLPEVQVDFATAVTGQLGDKRIQLLERRPGEWQLPRDNYDGPVAITAEANGARLATVLRFVLDPGGETFRQPGRPGRWLFESQAASTSLLQRWPASDAAPAQVSGISDVTYLGRDVGVFVDTPEEATWEIRTFGRSSTRRLLVAADEVLPEHQVPTSGYRTRWRKMLKNSFGPAEDQVVRRIVGGGGGGGRLPHTPERNPPPVSPTQSATSHPRLTELLTVLVSVSNTRTGIDRAAFDRYVDAFLGGDRTTRRPILRAFTEAGLIDQLVDVSWSGKKLLAVAPHLIVFEVDGRWRATVGGLALPSTLSSIQDDASQHGIATQAVASLSQYVPATVTLEAITFNELGSLASRFRLPIRPLDPQPFSQRETRDLVTSAPNVGYEHEEPVLVRSAVTLQRHWRRGGPAHWSVNAPGLTTWSHYYDAAMFWAIAFDGPIDCNFVSSTDFTVSGAHLPLAAARWLSSVGGARSGPVAGAQGVSYAYSAPTNEVRARFVEDLESFRQTHLEQMQSMENGRLS